MRQEVNRVLAEVDLSAIRDNLKALHAGLSPETQLCAVVKANAYGHGAAEVSGAAEELPFVWGFAAATLDEALFLRSAGIRKPILVLGYVKPCRFAEAVQNGIRLTLFEEEKVSALRETAAELQKTALFHIKVDTGMNRIGLRPDDTGLLTVQKMLSAASGHASAEGIFTHLATADLRDPSAAEEQVRLFRAFTGRLAEKGIRFPLVHSANSASTVLFDNTGFNLCRVGISLYGLYPSDEADFSGVPVRPAMSWYSEVTYVKTVPAGEKVGYGASFETERETRIATVSCGYADGYPRSLSNRGQVLIRGRRFPVIGKVCMDQMMVDVTEDPSVREGDVVTLAGRDGGERITMEELGCLSGRFNYELVCDITARVPRAYI